MGKLLDNLFGQKINKARVFPVTLKIIIVFTLFILVSNLSSNYINLIYNRTELIGLMRNLLTKDLKDANTFCNNQYEIFQYTKDLNEAVAGIENKGVRDFTKKKSVLLGVKPDGTLLFQGTKIKKAEKFADAQALKQMADNQVRTIQEGFINFRYNNEDYFGAYKHNANWSVYIVRAEELNEFYEESRNIFIRISVIILLVTLISAVVGIFLLRFILRYIPIITSGIMKMVSNQQLELIDLSKAPNDDITYLGVAFNSLSNTINNLVNIFRKFTSRDIAIKAYKERDVRLEGNQRDLAILFTDIKSFTFITETLGADIIKLLNLHYDQAIREIMRLDGVIGSIIGDALLAVFGVFEESTENKSLQAVTSAYKVQEVAESLRARMHERKEQIMKEKGALSRSESRVFKAVLLEVGVGIDGGNVFYGTIGSYERMTNTVIGDNVNAASRLEGLTRIYKVPVICSDYVRKDIVDNVSSHGIRFVELDQVMVKGKTTAKKVYWPLIESTITPAMEKNLENYSAGLKAYYNGDWKKAYLLFKKCSLPLAEEFVERTKTFKSPKNWNGVWEMKTK
ncbi:MAG TPA: adenylate/guanylate cyclase domain-containing protein [Spirochaetota bacterium]|nr:adenylate/guanylate cyclase domain-containing protein [Spirochaetota bacterium]